MDLDLVALKFQAAGISSLIYDHRNTGASDGLPRNEINPHQQAEDYHEAVTLLTTLPEVDTPKIAVWGYSLAGGHVVKAAAIDRRIKAVISIGPLLSSVRVLNRLMPRTVRPIVDASLFADRAARINGDEVAYGLVTTTDPSVPAFIPTPDAAEWTSRLQKTKAPNWENKYTVQSMFHLFSSNPVGFLEALSPTPWLMVQGDDDNMCTPDVNLEIYQQAKEPKELVMYEGGHFDPLTGEVFEETMVAQIEFLKRRLKF